MGFAKYQEDIMSRYVSDNRDREKNIPSPVHVPEKKKQNAKQKGKSMALKQFAVQKARPLPVIILADTSGSMSVDGKIEALNEAIRDMIATFAKEGRQQAEIQLVLVTFGGSEAEIHLPLIPAHEINDLKEMTAAGPTPMGGAFDLVTRLLEDKDKIPSRAYRPALVLLSDGHPTDDWAKGFKALCESDRAKKATRFAMAIGGDADESMLKNFVNDDEAPVFKANQARDIHRFFKAITMSVTARTRSQSPNEVPAIDFDAIEDEGELDLDF
ncbi:VWA domain-containing protein [Halioglobus sp.]|nr:VWA domain-containing protein [Halioglobus sp.]